jgi:hypothetical protein
MMGSVGTVVCVHTEGIMDTLGQGSPVTAKAKKRRRTIKELKSDGTSWRRHWCLPAQLESRKRYKHFGKPTSPARQLISSEGTSQLKKRSGIRGVARFLVRRYMGRSLCDFWRAVRLRNIWACGGAGKCFASKFRKRAGPSVA